MRMKTTRAITCEECPWLDADIPAGITVHTYPYCTYGAISDDGIAITFQEDETPFLEVPKDAVSPNPVGVKEWAREAERQRLADGISLLVRREAMVKTEGVA